MNYEVSSHPSTPHEIYWTKPRPRCYKLNTDAAFHDNGTGGAVGIVLRNSIGEAVASTTCLFVSTLDATSAEALAMLKGLELLERLGCTNIIIEFDSLELINACKGEVDMFSPYTTTLVECFAKAQTIDGISFEFFPREVN